MVPTVILFGIQMKILKVLKRGGTNNWTKSLNLKGQSKHSKKLHKHNREQIVSSSNCQWWQYTTTGARQLHHTQISSPRYFGDNTWLCLIRTLLYFFSSSSALKIYLSLFMVAVKVSIVVKMLKLKRNDDKILPFFGNYLFKAVVEAFWLIYL